MRNDFLLNHEVNKTFEEVLWMDEDSFYDWCVNLRRVVVYAWDVLKLPPRVGYSKDEIAEAFRKMESFPVKQFIVKDELTGQKDVIRNTTNFSGYINDWFDTMMKVPINYTNDSENGRSIYDFFARDDLLKRFITYAKRHFKRDSFYAYSIPLQVDDKRFGQDLPVASDSISWLYQFIEEGYNGRGIYSFWLAPTDDKEYTGYNEKLQGQKYLTLTRDQIKILKFNPQYTTNVTDKSDTYQIRVFKLGQKLFPVGLKAWRVSFCQYATNYPPLTAKLIMEMYTTPGKQNIIWDPSTGWGGRLLGALSVKDDREIVYISNDPNTDHTIKTNYTKYHDISYFYKDHVKKGGLFASLHTDCYFIPIGSEEMQHNLMFKSVKGKVDLVFTSPPYFAKEAYSEDEAQSYKKFSTYDVWKQGFLYETLKTAFEWLVPGGHLVWNISDVQFGKDVLPLIQDSKDICEGLGFKYIKTWKMSLAQMPGGNRLDTETGQPKTRYFCKVNGIWLKYEPMLVFQK